MPVASALHRSCASSPLAPGLAYADDPAKPAWTYSADLIRPFWQGTVVEGESVLFVKDDRTAKARASVLFPIQKLLAVRNSSGDVTYEEGRDYVWKPESREIVLPAGSRIVASTPAALRRPPKSQKYELTHRDGNGEILFGARLEYHELQTCIRYAHAPDLWPLPVPTFDPKALPRTIEKLRNRQPLRSWCWGTASHGLQRFGLGRVHRFSRRIPNCAPPSSGTLPGKVELTNLSVGGTDTRWG